MRRLALILLSLSLIAGGSRDFDGTADFFAAVTVPRGTDPMSHVCWGDVNGEGVSRTLFAVTDTASNNNYWDIRRYGPTNGTLSAERGTINQFAIEAGATTGAWHHFGGTFLSNSTRDAWLNNGFTTDTGNSGVPGSIDTTAIGTIKRIDPLQLWDGQIAYCAMWSSELTDDHMGDLFAGLWPSWVDTGNLVVFYPLLEGAANDAALNWMGNSTHDLTANTTPAVSANGPPVFWPIGGM